MSILTPNEVAGILKVSSKTIIRIIEAGKLPAIKVGKQWRVDQNDFNAYIKKQSTRKIA